MIKIAKLRSKMIFNYSSKHLTLEDFLKFNENFNVIQKDCVSPRFAIFESPFQMIDSFQQWLPQLVQNYKKITPLIIAEMLFGNSFAEGLYKELYQKLGRTDFIIGDQTLSSGLNTPEMAAKNWLISKEAESIFKENNGEKSLCEINEVLGLVNEFVNC